MARKMVGITSMLWVLIASIAVALVGQPLAVFLPLYGLYPGEISSGPAYHPARMHTWAAAAGAVFLALGLIAVLRDSKPAAIAFLIFFILSTCMVFARFASAMSELH
jgi:hypothetical protein